MSNHSPSFLQLQSQKLINNCTFNIFPVPFVKRFPRLKCNNFWISPQGGICDVSCKVWMLQRTVVKTILILDPSTTSLLMCHTSGNSEIIQIIFFWISGSLPPLRNAPMPLTAKGSFIYDVRQRGRLFKLPMFLWPTFIKMKVVYLKC